MILRLIKTDANYAEYMTEFSNHKSIILCSIRQIFFCIIIKNRKYNLKLLAQEIGIIGYAVTFILGLVGHSCSLLTFSQSKLRSISTTVLFLSITICDMSYLFMSLHDFICKAPQLSPYYILLCRFRTFIINFTQTTSAWLFICVAFDRLIRTRLSHRTRQWCTHKYVLIAVFIVILCSVAFNSHVLQSNFTTMLPDTRVICGPLRFNVTDYTIFYYITWPALQICIDSVGPALLMIVCLIIFYRKVWNENQMLLIMLSKTILFLVCTLPYSAFRMATIYSLDSTN